MDTNQESVLFGTSITENIEYGKEDETDKEVNNNIWIKINNIWIKILIFFQNILLYLMYH